MDAAMRSGWTSRSKRTRFLSRSPGQGVWLWLCPLRIRCCLYCLRSSRIQRLEIEQKRQNKRKGTRNEKSFKDGNKESEDAGNEEVEEVESARNLKKLEMKRCKGGECTQASEKIIKYGGK